jgi:hypothetical protein
MAYHRRDSVGEFTTEALLEMAMNMLVECQQEQMLSRTKNKWLVNNSTLTAIKDRVVSFGEPRFENAPETIEQTNARQDATNEAIFGNE